MDPFDQRQFPFSPAARARCLALFQAMEQAAGPPPRDLLAALRALPDVGTLPSPWTTWVLIHLFRYRRRQRWGRRLLRARLPRVVPPSRKLRRRSQPVKLYVPGAPEWEVLVESELEFATLCNRVTGELVTVAVSREYREGHVAIHHLHDRVKPQTRWEPAGRLLELHPRPATLWLVIDDLEAAGVVRRVFFDPDPGHWDEEPDAHRLSRWAASYARLAPAFCRAWAIPKRRLWMAAAVGDWLLAAELATAIGDADLIALTRERADACRQQRLELIREEYDGKEPACTAELHALEELGTPGLAEYVRRGLYGSARSIGAAMWYIADSNNPDWCRDVYDLLLRIHSDTSAADQEVSGKCIEFLLCHGYRVEEAVRLIPQDEWGLDELALIALEHLPDTALPVVRRALRAGLPPGRPLPLGNKALAHLWSAAGRMAADLAIIDLPWTRRELLDALHELQGEGPGPDLDRALPLVLALAESSDAETREIAAAWEALYNSEEYRLHADDFMAHRFEPYNLKRESRLMRLRTRTWSMKSTVAADWGGPI